MKRLKISKTEALAVLLLRTQRLARMRNSLLLAALVLALTCAASPVLAGFDEGVTAYKAGDFTLAREEFLKTAEQGDAGAQYYLGLMYYNGQGVAQNYQAAGMVVAAGGRAGGCRSPALSRRDVLQWRRSGTGLCSCGAVEPAGGRSGVCLSPIQPWRDVLQRPRSGAKLC